MLVSARFLEASMADNDENWRVKMIEDKKGTDDIKERKDNIPNNIKQEPCYVESKYTCSSENKISGTGATKEWKNDIRNDIKQAECVSNSVYKPQQQHLGSEIDSDYFKDLADEPPLYSGVNSPNTAIKETIERITATYRDSHIFFIPGPNNSLCVVGTDIEQHQLEIKAALKCHQLSKVEVMTLVRRHDGLSYMQLLGCEVQKLLHEAGVWRHDRKAHCELVLIAEETRPNRCASQVAYSVLPAHLILTADQRRSEEIAKGDSLSSHHHLGDQAAKARYEFDCGAILADSHATPLLAYRHWDSRQHSSDSEQSKTFLLFMNDMVLLKLKNHECDLLKTETPVFPIPSKEHLDALADRQQSVVIANLEGRLMHHPSCVGPMDSHFGFHLAFIITSKDEKGQTKQLRDGDSGRVVFLKGKENKWFSVGMLVGRFPVEIGDFDSSMYQAIVLSQAFQEMQHKYPDVTLNAETYLLEGHNGFKDVGQNASLCSAEDGVMHIYQD